MEERNHGDDMKHRTTRSLFEYWRNRRQGRPAPSRADIEPADIHGLLGDTFVLECDSGPGAPFRLAGTRICVIFNRELRGLDFSGFWRAEDRDAIVTALSIVRAQTECCAMGWRGATARGHSLNGELVLLPLTMGGTEITRILGAMVGYDQPFWLGSEPVLALELRSIRVFDAEEYDTPVFAPWSAAASLVPQRRAGLPAAEKRRPPVRRVAHLDVYEGGRKGE